MNEIRRQKLVAMIEVLTPLQEPLEIMKEEEIDAFRSLPLELQETDTGRNTKDASEYLTQGALYLAQMLSALQSATET